MGAEKVTLAETASTTDSQMRPVERSLGTGGIESETDWLLAHGVGHIVTIHMAQPPLGGCLGAITGYGVSGIGSYDLGISTQLRPIDEAPWIEVATGIRTIPVESRWRRYVSERLHRIESGVDREGGEPYPSPITVSRARMFAEYLFTPRTATPSVVPTDDGGVSFVWHKGGFDVDIEVSDDEVFVCVYHSASGTSFYGASSQHLAGVKAVLESISNLP